MMSIKSRFTVVLLIALLISSFTVNAFASDWNVKKSDVKHKVPGGSIYFRKSNGTIVGATEKITSANIPAKIVGKTVKAIGEDAFTMCKKLKSITIPKTMTSIKNNAFGECFSLTKFTVKKGNKKFAVVSGVLFNKAKTTILKYPGAKSGASYTIPSTVTKIGENAFANSRKLKTLTIGKKVKSINEFGLTDSDSMNAFKVASGNNYYKATGGVLFSKNMKTLVKYPEKKSGNYVILDSVETIGEFAFTNAENMNVLTFGKSVKKFGEGFWNCPKTFEVNAANPNYSAKVSPYDNESLLYNKAGTALLLRGGDRGLRFVIPEGTTYVGEYGINGAFALCAPKSITGVHGMWFGGKLFAETDAVKNIFKTAFNSNGSSLYTVTSPTLTGPQTNPAPNNDFALTRSLLVMPSAAGASNIQYSLYEGATKLTPTWAGNVTTITGGKAAGTYNYELRPTFDTEIEMEWGGTRKVSGIAWYPAKATVTTGFN